VKNYDGDAQQFRGPAMPVYNVRMRATRSHAAIIAALLLLLPLLYVGSYLALVRPSGGVAIDVGGGEEWYDFYPLLGNDNREAAAWFFWPVNQLDRKVRPGTWDVEGFP
jgi:hypothetical protein